MNPADEQSSAGGYKTRQRGPRRHGIGDAPQLQHYRQGDVAPQSHEHYLQPHQQQYPQQRAVADGPPHHQRTLPGPARMTGPGTMAGPGVVPGSMPGPGVMPGTMPGPGVVPGSMAGPGVVPGSMAGPGVVPGSMPGPGVVPGTMPGPGVVPGTMAGPGVVPGSMPGPGVMPGTMAGPGVVPGSMAGPGVMPKPFHGAPAARDVGAQERFLREIQRNPSRLLFCLWFQASFQWYTRLMWTHLLALSGYPLVLGR